MERSEDWMNQANSDLDHAEFSMSRQHYDWSCFASQQAAEKAVKGLFQKLGISAWGCSIADLLEDYRAREENNVPNGLYDAALELDKMFYSTRYPDQHPTRHPHDRYTRSEAQRAIEKAKDVINFCSEICIENGTPEDEEGSGTLSRVKSNAE